MKKIGLLLSMFLLSSVFNSTFTIPLGKWTSNLGKKLGLIKEKPKTVEELLEEKRKLSDMKVETVKKIFMANIKIGNLRAKLRKTKTGSIKHEAIKLNINSIQKNLEVLKEHEKSIFFKIKNIDNQIKERIPTPEKIKEIKRLEHAIKRLKNKKGSLSQLKLESAKYQLKVLKGEIK